MHINELLIAIVELYRKAATSLPSDIEEALRISQRRERKAISCRSLSVILENIKIARERGRPICQDTGVPIFFLKIPENVSYMELKKLIIRATRIGTKKIPLRPNAVDVLTEKNSGDNTGTGFPVIYCEETKGNKLIIDLLLKGSGSENIGQIYRLPDPELKAERNWQGVGKCVFDTVYKAQGKGCPPYIIGVGVGATKDQVTKLSKKQLIRNLNDRNANKILSKIEEEICRNINMLDIGPLGFGGITTALGVKIGVNHRHPASYFVDVAVSCWAHRKARLIWGIQDSKLKIQN